MKITVFYVGSSLLAPLKQAEREINRQHGLDLSIAAHNFGAPFSDEAWSVIERDLGEAEVVFVIHVMDGENAARLMPLLDRLRARHRAVVVINCMPELMKRTHMGKLDFARLPGMGSRKGAKTQSRDKTKESEDENKATSLLASVGSWIGRQARGNQAGNKRNGNGHDRSQYLKYVNRLPALLRYVPGVGALRDVKVYLGLFCYFLQPTPANIRSMILTALKNYVPDDRLKQLSVPPPESMPALAIYHPDAAKLFESFEAYEKWYGIQSSKSKDQRSNANRATLNPDSTIGLLLMRPQIVSNAHKHYDALIRAIEAEGLSVIPAISTLMDNRQACERFFVETGGPKVRDFDSEPLPTSGVRIEVGSTTPDASPLTPLRRRRGESNKSRAADARVSQIVSLTGFSFVGGPAMNDSEAASEFLSELNIPYRSLVSLDAQTIESWRELPTGLNPVQTGMQVAIPEIDGATEPFIFGGIPERGVEPAPLEDRCLRIARRLKRMNRLQTAARDKLKVALVIYCFPPNKGNIGTAADLDVFPSLWDTLRVLAGDGYNVQIPESADALREMLLGGNSEQFDATANAAYRMTVDEYRRICPFVSEIEAEWGTAPGTIDTADGELLIQGLTLGNVFLGVQPTFGYEGDPMKLLMAKGGTPHHGFAAFYAYLENIFQADVVVHVGTHGAMEFMPGKQVGLSGACWPDRLIGELPNVYLYSVNNPSEGTIAKRRSYAQLISYLTPPIESAGLYRGLASLKDLIGSYRASANEDERERLFAAIELSSKEVNFNLAAD